MMTDGCQRSINTLELNGKGDRTQEVYTRAVRMLLVHGRLPKAATTSPRDSRKATHATVIFWTPMKSSGSALSPWTSRQSSTASRTLAINSSSDVACV